MNFINKFFYTEIIIAIFVQIVIFFILGYIIDKLGKKFKDGKKYTIAGMSFTNLEETVEFLLTALGISILVYWLFIMIFDTSSLPDSKGLLGLVVTIFVSCLVIPIFIGALLTFYIMLLKITLLMFNEAIKRRTLSSLFYTLVFSVLLYFSYGGLAIIIML